MSFDFEMYNKTKLISKGYCKLKSCGERSPKNIRQQKVENELRSPKEFVFHISEGYQHNQDIQTRRPESGYKRGV